MKYIYIFFLFCSHVFSQDNRGYIIKVGDTAPTFKINNTNSSELFHNKVVMLQFTASWCSVCIKEMPFIETEIWQQYKNNDNFILFGLAKDTPKRPQKDSEIEFMIEKTQVTYPIITDSNSGIFNLFADSKAGVTRNIIINKKGEIAFLTRLFDIEEFNEMTKVIRRLIDE